MAALFYSYAAAGLRAVAGSRRARQEETLARAPVANNQLYASLRLGHKLRLLVVLRR